MKNLKQFLIPSLLFSIIFSTLVFPQNIGTTSYINVNDIYLPFNRKGVIALVDAGPLGSTGQFAGGTFLFSSGFWLSGYSNSYLWANGVARSSMVEDYQSGIIGMDPNDPKAAIYKVTINDIPFGQSWLDWIDAVSLGADYYDGNNDGIYAPIDLNGNNQWDPDEDKPDLLLDETYWCVYNDGVPSNMRRWSAEPQGIEIRQTIFAMASTGSLDNSVFVRYRIQNTGLVTDTLKEVYFSMQADADIGDATDDVFGTDTLRNSTYYYNMTSDAVYGNQVPSFMMDLLTGPQAYIPSVTFIDVNGNNIYENGIDTSLDTAIIYLGPKGIRIYPGAKNLEINSAVCQYNGDPNIREPANISEVRNSLLGLTIAGTVVNPCTFAFGQVWGGVPCDEVNPYYWFSGDPVANVGWISTVEKDVRGIGSVGPFKLVKNQDIEILLGYEIDRSSTPLGGITAVRIVSADVKDFHEDNFGYPIVSVETNIQEFSNYILDQNYPNPFNPSTTIRYGIPEQNFVTLKVFDILGNEIVTLFNEEKPAGSYEVEFNIYSDEGQNLVSGVYFYTISAGSFSSTKKMILLK